MEQSPSLMTITPELRNSIYESVLLGVQTVKIDVGGHLTNQPGLLATSRQRYARSTYTHRDFTQLIAFANGLDVELRKAIRREGRLRVMLSLDSDFDLNTRPAAEANLKTWLQYCGDSELCWHSHASTYDYVGTVPQNLAWIDALTVEPNHIGSFPLNASMATEWHDMCMAILLRDFIEMRGGG
ncbi:hypothetical protein LTR56_022501 [Elasticomyces elasticus]|nr:hypothetical protein LTR56_022501 [Elasticomyces elasticus]KAK3632044.1 hypothetical protein LTR22_020784 [Elasticomyces elasticus]KAK4910049.1 hypothetical protein LTR49_021247 [Elasticomyces elasticus]KAK5749409.1 hypothetical protein LTS12_020519 [Elasticomyces elasticus]